MFDLSCGVTYTINGMKTRVLLVMLIIFIVVAGVCITCGTIFVVRDVEVVDATAQAATPLCETEINDIISKSGLQGKNILFNLNQDQVAKNVKSVNPLFKLQSVTAQFPSRVVLVVSRRVPVFSDSKNDKVYDAEMCIVEGTAPNTIDIGGANLSLADNLNVGDIALGKDDWAQMKIDQLKIIANYYKTLNGFQITYDDTPEAIGNNEFVCLKLKISSDITYTIKTRPGENFLRALEFTEQICHKENVSGEYRTLFDVNKGKVYTQILDDGGNNIKGTLYYER